MNSTDPYAQLQMQASPFQAVIVQFNALLPLLCVVGIMAGGILVMCKSKWGYYIIGVSLAGLAARMFLFS